ncbi:hypothetical protein [Arthrobacter bambusae]|uniref:hypothetical protein n=1 Tax=Arthrobacter bambusae TaxID=1338426 RepID=UPI00278387BA|nr:hypothetical protein [Arthrobacter bambusae]MDQ0029965.1 hypothetical protein [Arthrobacter bambusae]MDQ0097517.1 hypothetical protein [Arthrobacter bambusae]
MKRTALIKGTAPDATAPRTRPKDYVVVDDIGEFTYYRSEAAMLEDLEYLDEAACVLDREGNDCRLTLDKDRNLCLGPSLGPVEFSWLRQAWMNNRHRNLPAHRLQRFFPATREALVAELFEILTLERARNANGTPWVLHVGEEETHPATLRDIDGLLAGLDHLEQATVRDPFGHEYRPVRHQTHRHLAPGSGSVYYVEVKPTEALSC